MDLDVKGRIILNWFLTVTAHWLLYATHDLIFRNTEFCVIIAIYRTTK